MHPHFGRLWVLKVKWHIVALAMFHQLIHAQHELVGRVDTRTLFTHEVWQTPDVFGVCAAQRQRTAIIAASGAEGSAGVSKPYSLAHWVCYELSQLFQNVRMQEVSATTLLCEIELKCVESMFTDSLSHTPRSAEHLDEERARDQVEVSLLGAGVSA